MGRVVVELQAVKHSFHRAADGIRCAIYMIADVMGKAAEYNQSQQYQSFVIGWL